MRTGVLLAFALSLATASAEAQKTETITAQPAGTATKVDEEIAAPPPRVREQWNPTSGARGSRGVHRVEAGQPLPEGELALSLSGTFFIADGLLASGDHNERQRQQLDLTWGLPWVRGLEISLRQSSTTNTNSAFQPRVTQTLGDPEIGLKYSLTFADWIGVGAIVAYQMPTSPGGSGLAPEAFRLTALALGTFSFTSWLEVSVNLGGKVDFSSQLFPPNRQLNAAQLFSAEIAETSLFLAGLGVATQFELFDFIGLGPFAEMTFGVGDAPIQNSPLLATFGTKVYPAGGGSLELSLGADVRILGEPGHADGNSQLPGLPPWELFGRLTVHLFGPDDGAAASGTAAGPAADMPCDADDDCQEGRRCHRQSDEQEGVCAVIREVVKVQKEEVVRAAPTWIVEGTVLDQSTGRPVPNAVVEIVGAQTSALAVDRDSGVYRSYPLPVGDGLVQLKFTAPGYLGADSTMPRGKESEVKKADVQLQPLSKELKGELKGSLKDARTGAPVAGGQVFIPKLNERLDADQEGQFSGNLTAGKLQILISAKGYITQKKEIEVRPGDTIILNVDLQPKKR